MKEVTITLSDNLYKYLLFLEKTRFIKSKEEALSTALEFYRILAMHDWLPYTYRVGGGRVLLLDSTMLLDLFHYLTNLEIYDVARTTAMKIKLMKPFFKDVDFSNSENWSIVLKDLENMGWGKFTRFRDEIKVEFCIMPAQYLKGYFEGMFGTEFAIHPSKIPNVIIFIAKKTEKKKTRF